jgi:Protein of unknown function (DUF3047)
MRKLISYRICISICLVGLVAASGCAVSPLDRIDNGIEVSSKIIPSLTEAEKLIGSPKGWRALKFPTKRETKYALVTIDGRPAIQAKSNSSASSLAADLDIDLMPADQLQWSWRIDNMIPEADTSIRDLEDSPARIVLAFDGDIATLSIKEQLFNERASLITGRKFPYATLMYVCDNKKAINEIITNPHSNRIKKIVVVSGSERLKTWETFSRNIVADYTLAFGTPPGKLIGIAVMNDTDNTGSQATTFFGDLKLQTRGLVK